MQKLKVLKPGDLVVHRHKKLKHGVLISVDSQPIFDGSDCVCQVLFAGSSQSVPASFSNLVRFNS